MEFVYNQFPISYQVHISLTSKNVIPVQRFTVGSSNSKESKHALLEAFHYWTPNIVMMLVFRTPDNEESKHALLNINDKKKAYSHDIHYSLVRNPYSLNACFK